MTPSRNETQHLHARTMSEPQPFTRPIPSPTSPIAFLRGQLGLSALRDPFKLKFSSNTRAAGFQHARPTSPSTLTSNQYTWYSSQRMRPMIAGLCQPKSDVSNKAVSVEEPSKKSLVPQQSNRPLSTDQEYSDADVSMIVCRGSPLHTEEIYLPSDRQKSSHQKLKSPNMSPIRAPKGVVSPANLSGKRSFSMEQNRDSHIIDEPEHLPYMNPDGTFQPVGTKPTPLEHELVELQRMFLNQQHRANQMGLVLHDTSEKLHDLINTALDNHNSTSDDHSGLNPSDQITVPQRGIQALQQLYHQMVSGMDLIGKTPETQLLRDQVANLQFQIQWYESALHTEQQLRFASNNQQQFSVNDSDAYMAELEIEVDRLARENRAYAAAMHVQMSSNRAYSGADQSSKAREIFLTEALEAVFGVKNIDEWPDSQILERLTEWKKLQERALISTLFPHLNNARSQSHRSIMPNTVEEASNIVTQHIGALENALKNSSINLSRTKRLLRRTRATSQSTISDLHKTVAETEETTESEKERLLASQTIVERLTQNRDELVKSLDTEREQSDILKLKIARLESKITATEVELESNKESLRNTQAYASDLRHKQDLLNGNANESDASTSQLVKESQSLRAELETCQVELKECTNALAESKLEKERLTKIIDDQSNDLNRVSRELSIVLGQQALNAVPKVDNLNEETFKQMCNTLENLEQENSKLKFEYVKTQNDLVQANARADELLIASKTNPPARPTDVSQLDQVRDAETSLQEKQAYCDRLIAENAELNSIITTERNEALRFCSSQQKSAIDADKKSQMMLSELVHLKEALSYQNNEINRMGCAHETIVNQLKTSLTSIQIEKDGLVSKMEQMGLNCDHSKCQNELGNFQELDFLETMQFKTNHKPNTSKSNELVDAHSGYAGEKEVLSKQGSMLGNLLECNQDLKSQLELANQEISNTRDLLNKYKEEVSDGRRNLNICESLRDLEVRESTQLQDFLANQLIAAHKELSNVMSLQKQILQSHENQSVEFNQMKCQSSSLKEELEAAINSANQMKRQSSSLKEELEAAINSANQMKRQSSSLKEELEAAINSADIAHRQVAKLEAQINTMEQAVNKSQVLKSQITLQNEVIGQLKAKDKAMSEQIKMMEQDKCRRIIQLEQVTNDQASLYQELDSIQNHSRSLEHCIEEMNTDIHDLKNKNSKLFEDTVNLRRQEQMTGNENVDLRSKLESLVADMAHRDQQIDTLSRELGSLKNTSEHNEKHINTIRQERSALRARISDMEQQMRHLSSDLREQGDRLMQAQQSLNQYHDVHIRIQEMCKVRSISRQVPDPLSLLELVQIHLKKLELAAEDVDRLNQNLHTEKLRILPNVPPPLKINEVNNIGFNKGESEQKYNHVRSQSQGAPSPALIHVDKPSSPYSSNYGSPTRSLFVEPVTDKLIVDNLQGKAARLQSQLSELSGTMHRIKNENKRLTDAALQTIQFLLGDQSSTIDPVRSLEDINRQIKSAGCTVPIIQLPELVQHLCDEFGIVGNSTVMLKEVVTKARITLSTIDKLSCMTGEPKDGIYAGLVSFLSLVQTELNLGVSCSLNDIKRSFIETMHHWKRTLKSAKELLYATHISNECIPGIIQAYLECNGGYYQQLKDIQVSFSSINSHLDTRTAQLRDLGLQNGLLKKQWSQLCQALNLGDNKDISGDSDVFAHVISHAQNINQQAHDLGVQVRTLLQQVNSSDSRNKEFLCRVKSANVEDAILTFETNSNKLAKSRSKYRLAKQKWTDLTNVISALIPETKKRSEMSSREEYHEYIMQRLQQTLAEHSFTHPQLIATLQKLSGAPVTELRMTVLMQQVQGRINLFHEVEHQIMLSLQGLDLSYTDNLVESILNITNEVHDVRNVIELCKRTIHNTGHGQILKDNGDNLPKTLMQVLTVSPDCLPNEKKQLPIPPSSYSERHNSSRYNSNACREHSGNMIQKYDQLKSSYRQLISLVGSLQGTPQNFEIKVLDILACIEDLEQCYRTNNSARNLLISKTLKQLADVVHQLPRINHSYRIGLVSEAGHLQELFLHLDNMILCNQEYRTKTSYQDTGAQKRCARIPVGMSEEQASRSLSINASLARTLKALQIVDYYDEIVI